MGRKVKRCISCGQDKDESEFSYQRTWLGQRKARCKVCLKTEQRKYYLSTKQSRAEYKARYQVEKREEARRYVSAILSRSKCSDCGESDPLVLTFDHIKGQKRMNISQMVNQGYSKNAIHAEISKCEIVCANCHLRREKKRRGTIYPY